MSSVPTEIYRDTLRYFLHPVQKYLDNPEVSEIMINGHREVWIEVQGKLERIDGTFFEDEESLEAAVTNIAQFVGRHIRPDEPRFDARLPEGHRVHVVLPPLCRQGISVTIRKHSKQHLDLEHLIEMGSLTEEVAEFLGECIERRCNLLVSGGTGTGKTTLLNVLSGLIPGGERIVVIEDSSELQIRQEHVVNLEARPADRKGRGAVTIRDLLHSALRMRPDRILIGECRGGEALDLLQAMNTGHTGSMSTLHADSAAEALHRLEMLALFGGVDIPIRFLRAQVAAAIHVVVQLQRFAGDRIVQSVMGNRGLDENGNYQTVELFSFEDGSGKLVREDAAASFLAR